MATNSMFELSQKLETKQQQDRTRFEKHTLSELKRHAKNLRDGLSGELATTKAGISDQLNEITTLVSSLEATTKSRSSAARKTLMDDLTAIKEASSQNRQAALNSMRWGWLKYSLPALMVLLAIFAGSWGLVQWQSHQLMSTQQEIQQARETLNRLPQGVRFAQDASGQSFLVFETEPEHYRVESGSWVIQLTQP